MAFNFDSEQFNKESTPRHLGNMAVPRWSPTKPRPLEMRPDPKPICDNNGHFLPGAPRGKSKCFGHYTGTWDLPRKITREVAAELAKEPPEGRFTDWINLRVQRPKAAAEALERARLRGMGKVKKVKPPEPDPSTYIDSGYDKDQDKVENNEPYEDRGKGEDDEAQINNRNEDDPLGLFEKKEPVNPNGNSPYIPGSLTDPDKRHDSYDRMVKEAVEQIHGPQQSDEEKFWQNVAENAKRDEIYREDKMKVKKESETLKLPQVNVSQNFQFAKKMHVGNLEHQPLPDTLGYRNLTKIAEHRDSDIVVKPYAIGWKGYGASGPTCCTKMRVHRPKTCDSKKEGEKNQNMRPATSCPDLGGQNKKPLTLMDLAICWDFRPDDPKKEPQPPKHIDGSNGSKAPAVFTMVHTPKEQIEEAISHSNPIFVQNKDAQDIGRHSVPYFERDMTKEKRKDSCDVQYCSQHQPSAKSSKSSSRKSSSHTKPKCDGIHGCGTLSDTINRSPSKNDDKRPDKLEQIKEAWSDLNSRSKYNFNQNRNSLESYEKTSLAQGKLHQSSPNDSLQSRRSTKDSTTNNNNKHKTCLSCNGTKITQENKQKEDYKFAFKAGNPNSVQSSASSTDSKAIKMPKMRHPYSKKNYTIPTLAPPFSIWRDANATGYPEHWRLASVYQHAYKPPEQRRRPLINSVYQ